jgi:hypothetical protein
MKQDTVYPYHNLNYPSAIQRLKFDIRRAKLGQCFDVTIGRATCKTSSATWNFDTNSASALGPGKTTEYLDRVLTAKLLLVLFSRVILGSKSHRNHYHNLFTL